MLKDPELLSSHSEMSVFAIRIFFSCITIPIIYMILNKRLYTHDKRIFKFFIQQVTNDDFDKFEHQIGTLTSVLL